MFKVDFIDGVALEWSVGGELANRRDYHPTLYAATERGDLNKLARGLDGCDLVHETVIEQHRTFWKQDREDVLRIDAQNMDAIARIGHHIRRQYEPGRFKLYNVDFSPQFRYCLETERTPVPDGEPSTLRVETTNKRISDQDISTLVIDGDEYDGSEEDMLDRIQHRLDAEDPDILVLSHAGLVPLLYSKAEEYNIESFRLGRMAGWSQLAHESSYESYGRVGHSPARYNVPGRAIIDLSNSFFMGHANEGGLWYLVEQSWKPIQEASWASIGNVLTAIQIRHAVEQDVLVPWRAWTPEQPKRLDTLHTSDRGGFMFSPKVGVHENVFSADFSSLYPNIICSRNLSPETVRCDCCDNDAVPGLKYSVCERDGYLGEVLQPLIEHRADIKEQLRQTADPERKHELQGRSDAIKWVLVSCFGYQGFSNSKWGQLRVHEAINAYAREILLDAKETFEEHGWRVLHGIVDSIWVQPREGEDQTDIHAVCDIISEEAGIRLDFEHQYDWITFCPKRESNGGALTRYFGKHQEGFKVRGIELRQHSTPAFIKDVQEDFLETFDQHREPGPVCDRLAHHIHRLENGDVDPRDLLIEKRISKEPSEYTQSIRSAAAVKRARKLHDHYIGPGQSVKYLVHNDDAQGIERIRLPYDDPDTYDTAFYRSQLIRATESILAPLDWDRNDIETYLSDTTTHDLRSYLEATP